MITLQLFQTNYVGSNSAICLWTFSTSCIVNSAISFLKEKRKGRQNIVDEGRGFCHNIAFLSLPRSWRGTNDVIKKCLSFIFSQPHFCSNIAWPELPSQPHMLICFISDKSSGITDCNAESWTCKIRCTVLILFRCLFRKLECCDLQNNNAF